MRKVYQGLLQRLERKGAKCWTMDIDPTVRRWGRPGRHVTGDLRSVVTLFPKQYFDVVFCNGIFGFGIDTLEAQKSAVEASGGVIRPGGWMLLGLEYEQGRGPVGESGIVTPWFEPAELPGFGTRQFVGGCTHVYDFLKLAADDRNVPRGALTVASCRHRAGVDLEIIGRHAVLELPKLFWR